MKPADKPEFVKLLNLCYSTLLRPLPPLEAIDLWVTILEPYSIEQVRAGLSQHLRESKFPPVPADVVQRMPKAREDRPDANEAWAISLRGRDERETVVWTQECAQAFGVASPVLESGDETGARMAFKAAYERLVERAREEGRPVQWIASLGHDPDLREAVIAEAVRAGRMRLEHAKAIVPAIGAPSNSHDPRLAQQAIALLRNMVAPAGVAHE